MNQIPSELKTFFLAKSDEKLALKIELILCYPQQ